MRPARPDGGGAGREFCHSGCRPPDQGHAKMLHQRISKSNPPEPRNLAKAISRIQKSLSRRGGPRRQRKLGRRLITLLAMAAEVSQ